MMAQHTTRRFVASFLLGAMTTALAACGVASGPAPLMPAQSRPNLAESMAAKTGGVPRSFGTTITPNTPRVKFVTGGVSNNLPPSADLRSKLSPVDDQGRIGSCTSFAVTGVAEFKARQRGNNEELSPGFIYLMNLQEQGSLGTPTGASVSTGVNVLATYGICPETLHPYLAPTEQRSPEAVEAYCSKLPSQAAMRAALPNRVTGLRQIGDIVGLKTAIANGQVVIFAIDVYRSFMSASTGTIPLPDTNSEERVGGHAIVAVGYDDVKRTITFRNSWGPNWGDKGYGTLPYDYFRSGLARDAWATTK